MSFPNAFISLLSNFTSLSCIEELGLSEFENLREEWDALVSRDPIGSIFDTSEWISAFWRTRLPHFSYPIIVTYRDNSGLKAGAAFRLRSEKIRFGHIKKIVLEFLPQGPSDYNKILVDPECDTSTFSTMLCEHLLHHSSNFDEVNLRNIHNKSKAYELLGDIGFRASVSIDSITSYLTLPKTWEQCLLRLNPKFRHNLKYYERKLKNDHPNYEIVALQNPSTNELGDFFRLHQLRMIQLSKNTELSISKNRRFHEEFVRAAEEKNWIRLYLLRISGETVAALYGFVFKGRFHFYLSGFHPGYSKYSPLNVLISASIRSSIAEGLYEYDFLRGMHPYKLRWTQNLRKDQRFHMTSRRPISLLKEVLSRSHKS